MFEQGKRVSAGNLKVGERYRVEIQDCCVEASFEAILAEIIFDDDPDPNYPDELRFSNGVNITHTGGGVTFYS